MEASVGRYFSKPDLYCSAKWAKGLCVERVELRDAPEFMRGLRLLFAAEPETFFREDVPRVVWPRLSVPVPLPLPPGL